MHSSTKKTSHFASHLVFHRFSPCNCCLSAVLQFDKWDYTENVLRLRVCALINKRSFEHFMCLYVVDRFCSALFSALEQTH